MRRFSANQSSAIKCRQYVQPWSKTWNEENSVCHYKSGFGIDGKMEKSENYWCTWMNTGEWNCSRSMGSLMLSTQYFLLVQFYSFCKITLNANFHLNFKLYIKTSYALLLWFFNQSCTSCVPFLCISAFAIFFDMLMENWPNNFSVIFDSCKCKDRTCN